MYFIEGDSFEVNRRKVQTTFRKLKELYPDYFEEFSFYPYGEYPYSYLVNEVFSGLMASGLLSYKNPEHPEYLISKKSRDIIYKTVLPKFTEKQKKQIKKISQDFQKFIIGSLD